MDMNNVQESSFDLVVAVWPLNGAYFSDLALLLAGACLHLRPQASTMNVQSARAAARQGTRPINKG